MALELFGYGLETPLPYVGVSLWNIFMFLLVLFIGFIIVRVVAGKIRKILRKQKVSKILAEFVARILRIILYVFVVGVALGFLGISVGAALVSVSVVLGFVLGFALGDTLSNIASGFMIAITKPFKEGDFVEIAGQSGVINTVGISITEMNTPDNKHVIIPNKTVWGGVIVNYTRNRFRRIDLETGVSYTDDLDKVITTTMSILKTNKMVLANPAPQVAVKEMADSAVVFVVRPWVKTDDYWDAFFDLQKALKQGYDKAGISIPFPQMDVHMEK